MLQKTEMRVLLYSAVLYLSGITVVLYLRPQLMFSNDGRWKEFGIQGIDTTWMPFWLFCVLWAVVAYAIVRTVFYEPVKIPVVKIAAEEALTPLPVPNTASSAQGKPGYYKLDEAVMKDKGVPRYVYIGPDKPGDLEA
jgi:hypothetical protein